MIQAKAKTEKEEAIEDLKRWMPRGTKVYTILRHVSASGMTRHISLVVFKDGIPFHPNYAAAKALGWRLVSKGGYDAVIVQGCGMDTGFHLVYSISMALYGKDAEGKYSHEGSYSLKQSWL